MRSLPVEITGNTDEMPKGISKMPMEQPNAEETTKSHEEVQKNSEEKPKTSKMTAEQEKEFLTPVTRLFHVRSTDDLDKFNKKEEDSESEIEGRPSMEQIWDQIASKHNINYGKVVVEQKPYDIFKFEEEKRANQREEEKLKAEQEKREKLKLKHKLSLENEQNRQLKVLCKANRSEWEKNNNMLNTVEFENLLKAKHCSHIAVENNSFQLKRVNLNRKKPNKLPEYKEIATFEFVKNKANGKRPKSWKVWKERTKFGLETLREKNSNAKILFMVSFRNGNLDVLKTLKDMIETPGLAKKDDNFKFNDPSTRIALIDQILKQINDFEFDGALLDFTGINLSMHQIAKNLENFLGDFLLRNAQEYITRSMTNPDAKKLIIAIRIDYDEIDHIQTEAFSRLNLMELVSFTGVRTRFEQAELIKKLEDKLRIDRKVITDKVCELRSPQKRFKRDAGFPQYASNGTVKKNKGLIDFSLRRNKRSPPQTPNAKAGSSHSKKKSSKPISPKGSTKTPKGSPKSPKGSHKTTKQGLQGASKSLPIQAKKGPSKSSRTKPKTAKEKHGSANTSPKVNPSLSKQSPVKNDHGSENIRHAKGKTRQKPLEKSEAHKSAGPATQSSPARSAHKTTKSPESRRQHQKAISADPKMIGHQSQHVSPRKLVYGHRSAPMSPLHRMREIIKKNSNEMIGQQEQQQSPLLDHPSIRALIGLPISPEDDKNPPPFTDEQFKLLMDTLHRKPAVLLKDPPKQSPLELNEDHRNKLVDAIQLRPRTVRPFWEEEDDEDPWPPSPAKLKELGFHVYKGNPKHIDMVLEAMAKESSGMYLNIDDDTDDDEDHRSRSFAGYETKLFKKDEC